MNRPGHRRLKVVLVGPLPPAVPNATNPVGGAAVNFAETVRQLQRRGFDLDIVDISRPRVNLRYWRIWYNNVTKGVSMICRVLLRIRHNDVVFLNIAAGRAWLIGASIWMLCTVFRRPMALRIFGGDFADTYDRYCRPARWLADLTYMRCACMFVQTRELLRRFPERKNIRWFANTRDVQPSQARCRRTVRKLLFVSQLRMEKGLGEALEACRELPSNCHLSVYGPRMPNTDFSLFEGHDRATYGGVLRPCDIANVMTQHDVLLLPSYFDSEGYPGIILEALQCGIPVISTWWRSIPEVVEHEKSGLLVEPRSPAALKHAILRLMRNPELYERLCRGAQERGDYFRSGVWYDRMAADLYRLFEHANRIENR